MAIAQISKELGFDENKVRNICDRIAGAGVINELRSSSIMIIPNLGHLVPAQTPTMIKRKKVAALIHESALNESKRAIRNKFKSPPKQESPAEEFYFDLEYL